MNRLKIEKQLFENYGTELFKYYHKGHILPLENTKAGIALSEIEHLWIEDYPYLVYPIFSQEPPVDDISRFTNESQCAMIFASPIRVEERAVKLGAYSLNQLFYYTSFDKPDEILRIHMPHSITDLRQIPILKIRLKNQQVYPILPEGNSFGCEAAGMFFRQGNRYIPMVEFDERPLKIKEILTAFGIPEVEGK